MENPGAIAVILSICVPLVTGTCCFIILGLLTMRHHQHLREEMTRLRLEASERSSRFETLYGYDTFAVQTQPRRHQLFDPTAPVDHAAGPQSTLPNEERAIFEVETDGVRSRPRAASVPALRLGSDQGEGLVDSFNVLRRPRLRRARRSSDPAASMAKADDFDENSSLLQD